MALNLDSLSPKLGATMPKTQRGRESTPVPPTILDAVKRTFTLPEGEGGSFTVPNGEKNENGKDVNVTLIVGQIRKAATQLGYGVAVRVMEPKSRTTEVLFRAQEKSERKRRTKDQIRTDKLIAEWLENGATEYDGAEDDAVALAAWETYVELPDPADDADESGAA